jgi:hypothetical protein
LRAKAAWQRSTPINSKFAARFLDRAESQELIASHEIDDVVYRRLCSHEPEDDNEEG